MNPRVRAILQILILLTLVVVLILLFPVVSEFAELAARELKAFWWLALMVGLALWLIFGLKRKPRR